MITKRMALLGLAITACLLVQAGIAAAASVQDNPPPLPKEPPPVMPGQPGGQVLPPPGPVVVHTAFRHQEFAKMFKPVEGTHKVTFIHPYTCCPVDVCFTLPCGCPKVICKKNELEFSYGRKEVEIRFYKCGDVKVTHREGCKLLNLFR